jgi:plastocyanin
VRRGSVPLAVAVIGLVLAVGVALGASHDVAATGNAFDPATLTVTAGDDVSWTNEDSYDHTVSSDTAGLFDERLVPGEIVELVFDEPGVFGYHCTIHAGMTGTVTVLAPAAPQIPSPPTPGTTTAPSIAPTPPDAPLVTRLRGTATRRGVRLRLRLDEPASISVRVLRRGELLVSRSVGVRSAGRVRVRVRGDLPRGRLTVRLVVAEEDGGGTVTRRLRLRVK